jgi:hypothetical protein
VLPEGDVVGEVVPGDVGEVVLGEVVAGAAVVNSGWNGSRPAKTAIADGSGLGVGAGEVAGGAGDNGVPVAWEGAPPLPPRIRTTTIARTTAAATPTPIWTGRSRIDMAIPCAPQVVGVGVGDRVLPGEGVPPGEPDGAAEGSGEGCTPPAPCAPAWDPGPALVSVV